LQVDWLGAQEGFAGAEAESEVCDRTVGMRMRARGRRRKWSIVVLVVAGVCWMSIGRALGELGRTTGRKRRCLIV